jgi:beta-glucanase (GH16 family)
MDFSNFRIALYALISIGLMGCRAQEIENNEPIDLSGNEPTIDYNDPNYWDDATLIWNDEFDGTELDTSKWKFEFGNHGWGNNEWQNYTDSGTTEVSNGILKIIADKIGPGNYTSARLNSLASFTYGRMEIRAKIPNHRGNGIWPAIWMLGSNIGTMGWPTCGEIDIMEYVSYSPNEIHFSLHSNANNHKQGTQITSGPLKLETVEEEFHNYGILWTRDYLKFYLDTPENVKLLFMRPLASNTNNWPFSQPFYFLLNIAIGGDWGGLKGVEDSIFPAVMEIDYVRVYQVQ